MHMLIQCCDGEGSHVTDVSDVCRYIQDRGYSGFIATGHSIFSYLLLLSKTAFFQDCHGQSKGVDKGGGRGLGGL